VKSTNARTVAVKQPVAVPDDASPTDTNAGDTNANVTNKVAAAAGAVAPQDQPADQPAVSPARQPDPSGANTALAAPEIAAMLALGKTNFDAGDVAAARLLFRRAANAGDAKAALAMGATYDPAVLASRLVRGMSTGTGADVDEARSWYERARELGSPEGPRRLDMLAHQ
jgi:TPR repeat protein